MIRAIALTILMVCCTATGLAADITGAKDHPLTGRFEGSEIIKYSYSDFDEYRFIVEPLTSGKKDEHVRHMERKEGKLTRVTYRAPDGARSLAVFRAYQDVLAENNFDTLFECSGNSGEDSCSKKGNGNNFKYAAPGYSVYRLVFMNAQNDKTRYLVARKSRPEGDAYVVLHVIQNGRTNSEKSSERVFVQVDVIEEKAQESKVVMVKASEMAEKIGESGKVALYGLYFDTNKATIKSDSRPTLDEIGKLLKDNPDLELLVVGHTDNQGDFDYNIDLSKRRAASVKKVLTSDYGIATSRLKSWGVGYTVPVTTNSSEQGRARNRRVELVGQ